MATQQTHNKIKVANPPLEDNARAYLTQDTAASATSITLTSVTGFPGSTDADFYVVIGEYGDEKAEIALIDASSVSGTTFTISSLVKSHEASDPVTFIGYNKITFYGLSSATSQTYNSLASINIDPTEQYTEYVYTSVTYSYFATAYFDSTNDVISGYSETVQISSFTRRSAERILRAAARKAMTNIEENKNSRLNWDTAMEILQDGLDEIIARKKRWSFWHTMSTDTTVANVAYISKPTNLTQQVFVKVNGNLLSWISPLTYNTYTSGTTVSTGEPVFYTEKNGQYYLYPTPNSAYTVEHEYYEVPDLIENPATELPIPLVPVLIYYCGAQFAGIRGNDKKEKDLYEKYNILLDDQIAEYSGPDQDGTAEMVEITSFFNDEILL